MKIEKAIELGPDIERSLRDHKFIDYADASKLGTEALKYVKDTRGTSRGSYSTPLPGETPEGDSP